MIKEIYTQRYGKALTAVILLILAIFSMKTVSIIQSWHSGQASLHSAQFKKEFMANPEDYWEYEYDEHDREKVIKYTLPEYIEKESYLFMEGSLSEVGPGEVIPADLSFMRYGDSSFFFVTAIVALCGFLLFFVDQKTSFNRFLFSLGVSRKQLFCGKLLYVALPLLGVFALGIAGMIVGLWLGIPQPYLNISIGQMVSSGFLVLVTCFFFFGISCFCGVMFGNLVFGPLTYVILMWSLQFLPNILGNMSQLGYYLIYHKELPEKLNYFNSYGIDRLYTFDLASYKIYWPLVGFLLFVGGVLLWWSYRKYQRLSLEHDGEYLLYPESRWPIWTLAVLYLSLFAIFGYTQIWNFYIYSQLDPAGGWDQSLSVTIFATVIRILLALAISTLLLFFGPIKKRLRNRREVQTTKLIRE